MIAFLLILLGILAGPVALACFLFMLFPGPVSFVILFVGIAGEHWEAAGATLIASYFIACAIDDAWGRRQDWTQPIPCSTENWEKPVGADRRASGFRRFQRKKTAA